MVLMNEIESANETEGDEQDEVDDCHVNAERRD